MCEDTVKSKYKAFKEIDPFPEIPASLLNSADIRSYVDTTGLIYPFYKKDLKSASYAARISGKCKFWDDDKESFKEVELLEKGDKFTLRPNSIAFVGIEPTFRLPDYIALRFNLTITHVYKGLLLGTGPLIDPGFQGRINIPLHNLTSNDYVFSFNDALIWIEFTKTSPIPNEKVLSEKIIETHEVERCMEYKPFPEEKTNKELDYYLRKALKNTQHEAIISSIPQAVDEAKKNASEASKSLASIKKWAIGGTFFGIVTILFAMGAIVYGSFSLQNAYYNGAINQINNVDNRLDSQTNSNKEEIQKLRFEVAELSKLLEKKGKEGNRSKIVTAGSVSPMKTDSSEYRERKADNEEVAKD